MDFDKINVILRYITMTTGLVNITIYTVISYDIRHTIYCGYYHLNISGCIRSLWTMWAKGI